MKKWYCIAFLLLGTSFLSNAQIQFGVKAGVNYNNPGDLKLADVAENAVIGATDKSGYHAGIWLRGKIPIIGIYVRPELVYTHLDSKYVYNNTTTSYVFQKIDIPVLFEMKLLNFAKVFAGPSFQYILQTDFDLNNISEEDFDMFSTGAQFGFGLEYKKLGLDARWERSLNSSETQFLDDNTNGFTIDNRINQIILSLSYRF